MQASMGMALVAGHKHVTCLTLAAVMQCLLSICICSLAQCQHLCGCRKCEATCWRSAKRSRPAGAADAAPAHKRQHALAPAGAVATALPSHSHPEQQPAREVAAALPPPGLLACSNAMMPHALADRYEKKRKTTAFGVLIQQEA